MCTEHWNESRCSICCNGFFVSWSRASCGFLWTRPQKRVVVCKMFSNFVSSWGFVHSAWHILMKVFSLLSLTRNLENFTTERITTALISCIGVCFALYRLWCGVLWSFIFSWAFQSLLSDKRKSAPHLNRNVEDITLIIRCTMTGTLWGSVHYFV